MSNFTQQLSFFFKFFLFLSNFIYLLAVLHGLWDPGCQSGITPMSPADQQGSPLTIAFNIKANIRNQKR